MDPLERVLKDNSGRLIRELTGVAGLTEPEARVFLKEAGRALVESYHWNVDHLGESALESADGIRELLSGISGRALSERVGLSCARTWDGLRTLVPAVVRGERGVGLSMGGHVPGT